MANKDHKPLRILFASPYKGVGGISQWARNILDFYRSENTTEVEIDLLPMGRKAGVNLKSKVKRFKNGFSDYSSIIKEERRMLKSKDYDVLHLCTSASMSLLKDLAMLAVAKSHHVRTVVHFHFGRIPEIRDAGNWEWKLLKRVVAVADVAIPIDQMSYDALAPLFGDKIRYLPNPVGQVVRDYVSAHKHEIERDEKMVFYAGHCIPTKGVCELATACKEIKGIRLVLAGRIKDEMRRQLTEISNGEPWLEIMGEVSHEETLHCMMRCGIFALPSYTEGFPNVILESMACGCSIVSTDVGETPQMLDDGDGHPYGLLIAPKDVEALKNAICQMLADKDMRANFRSNVERIVNEKYNIESVWLRMVEIWRNC